MSPALPNIMVSLVRQGKNTVTVEVPSGSTVEYALVKAGFSRDDYARWSFTDEEGDVLQLSTTRDASTQIVCGQKVDGA